MIDLTDKYFHVRVLIEHEKDNGKTQKVTEEYLIKAINVTDAEAKLVQLFVDENITEDYRITNIKETRIRKVIDSEE